MAQKKMYTDFTVYGRIKQKQIQGPESDDVVLVGTIAPITTLTELPTTTSGSEPTYKPGQTAIIDGVVYICTTATSPSSGTWNYTWTTAGDPSYENVIETVKAQGTALTVTNKAVDVTRSSLGMYDKSMSVNGTSYALESTSNTNLPTIYAPTTLGGASQFVKGNSSGSPQWQTFYNNKVSVNGSATTVMTTGSTAVSVYAPSSAGGNAGAVPRWPSSGNVPAWDTVDTAVTANSTHLVTSGAVATAIQNIGKPMIFKGTLGTGGTITALPTASATVEGDTYKVITAGTYASISAKVGDTFICAKTGTSTYEWVLIPSGDEPSGTVTNVATGTGLTGGPITTSGTISLASSYQTQHYSTTISVQNASDYTVPSSGTIGFTPKIVQVYNSSGEEIEVAKKLNSNTVTLTTSMALSSAETWTVNIIGW